MFFCAIVAEATNVFVERERKGFLGEEDAHLL